MYHLCQNFSAEGIIHSRSIDFIWITSPVDF